MPDGNREKESILGIGWLRERLHVLLKKQSICLAYSHYHLRGCLGRCHGRSVCGRRGGGRGWRLMQHRSNQVEIGDASQIDKTLYGIASTQARFACYSSHPLPVWVPRSASWWVGAWGRVLGDGSGPDKTQKQIC